MTEQTPVSSVTFTCGDRGDDVDGGAILVLRGSKK